MTPLDPAPKRVSIRHRRAVREPNRYVGPIIIMGVIALILQMYWMQNHWGEVTRRDYTELDPALLDKLKARIITLYECEYCLGNGSLDDPEIPGVRVLCDICRGVGYHATRRYSDADRMCLPCGGMGRLFDEEGQAVFCSRCDGRGMVEIQNLEFED